MHDQDFEDINTFLNKNPQGFQSLFSKYSKTTYSLLLSILKDKEEAKDALQDVFIIVHDKLHTFKQASRFSTWLYSIAYRFALKRLKKPFFSHDTIELDIAEEVQEEDTYSIESLLEGMQILLPHERTFLELFYFQEQSIKEISGITGESEGNVKVILHRARLKLKTFLLNNKRKFVQR